MNALPEHRRAHLEAVARKLFAYDPETGLITRRTGRGGKARLGSVAGGLVGGKGYRRIRIDEITLLAHRLAWLLHFGVWPKSQIDHINGNRSDNRLCNLREVTHMQNTHNQRVAHKTNKSGLLGACKKKNRPGFEARIRFDGASLYLGYFKTAEEAHAAYVTAKRAMHTTCSI